jgi:GTPase
MVSECTRHPLRSLLILVLIQVPVIAIFTKMDALDDEARNQLMWDDDVPLAKIKEEVPIRAKAIFNKNYLERLEKVKHRPRYVVQLRGMLLFVHGTATHSPPRYEQRRY